MRQDGDSGFTIIEMTIVLMLLAVMMGAGWMLMQSAGNIADQTQAQSQATDETRGALDRITRELRSSQEATENMGAVSTMTTNSISFYVDLRHDGYLDRVTYFMSGRSLMRRETSATTIMPPPVFHSPESAATTMVANISPTFTGAIFQYKNNYTYPPGTATIPQDVSSVVVRIVDTVTVGRKSATVDLSTWVRIRSVLNSINTG